MSRKPEPESGSLSESTSGSGSTSASASRAASPLHELPGWVELASICRHLSAAGIVHALGGSGLLAVHGFPIRPRDWDLTTDAAWSELHPALEALTCTRRGPSPAYPSQYLVRIPAGDREIELIGRFAIRTPTTVVRIPTRVSGRLGDVPLADPRDWLTAYRAMARVDRDGRAIDQAKIRMLEALLEGQPNGR